MILQADARLIPLRDGCVQTCVTSPPYWGLRDYGVSGQIGLEATPEAYVATMVGVFREVRQVLRDDGTVWLNLGDSYAGGNKGNRGEIRPSDKQATNKGSQATRRRDGGFLTPARNGGSGLEAKQLLGIPWRVAFALQGFAIVPFRSFSVWADELRVARLAQDWEAVEIVEMKLRSMGLLAGLAADGWWLRNDIIWAKPNPMPESVTDRPTRSHEYIFLLAKSERYFYDADAIRDEAAESSIARISQPNFANQTGGAKDYANGVNPSRSARKALENFALNPGRNKRDVWTINSEPTPEAHFATFPQKLVEPCILAGTSEKGCCAVCGAPRVRVTEKVEGEPENYHGSSFSTGKTGANGLDRVSSAPRGSSVTASWRPSCSHDAPSVPCLVLDPFLGSGTVGKVAERLGRRWVGLELSADYIAIAENGTAQMGIGI